MIPSILLLALIAGALVPLRWSWALVPAVTVLWVGGLLATGVLAFPAYEVAAAALFGAGNAVVGWLAGLLLRLVMAKLTRREAY